MRKVREDFRIWRILKINEQVFCLALSKVNFVLRATPPNYIPISAFDDIIRAGLGVHSKTGLVKSLAS